MSITVTESRVDYRYLMNRSKSDLTMWVQEQERQLGAAMTPYADLKNRTKDRLASDILAGIRELATRERLNHEQAVDVFSIPFGQVFYTEQGPMTGYWVFVGWASDGRLREAVFVRELQPGDQRGLLRPLVEGFNRSEDLLARFPSIDNYRKEP